MLHSSLPFLFVHNPPRKLTPWLFNFEKRRAQVLGVLVLEARWKIWMDTLFQLEALNGK